MRGASALDRLLAEFPEADLSVLIIWDPVLKSDISAPLTQVLGLLGDRRVKQFWDPDRVVSADLVRSASTDPAHYGFDEALPPEFVAWDVVAVFAKSAHWEHDLPVPVYYGGPVRDSIDGSRIAIANALADAGPASKVVPP